MNSNTGIIAIEGYPYIAYSSALTLFLGVVAYFFHSLFLDFTAFIAFLLSIFVISFFRNPERIPPGDKNAIVAPADGTVIVAERVSNSPIGTEALKISIFMSVFNVHVNRAPLDGKVVDLLYNSGKFYDARDGRASSENERNAVVLETAGGVTIAFVQIAGLIARRIICYPVIGDFLERGKRYGLIRFGSRVDIYLPLSVEPLVKLGDKTVAGETVVGRLG